MKIRFIGDCHLVGRKRGTEETWADETQARHFISRGYAEAVEEPKTTKPRDRSMRGRESEGKR